MMLFGLGDGGGGPQIRMLEQLKREENVDGLPRVQLTTPQDFFAKVRTETDHPTWVLC